MVKNKGAISEKTGTKLKIVEFILTNKGPIEEAEIRKKLHGDQGNTNRHLHELWEEFNFIELTQTIKKGRREYNLWDITKIEHLININKKFSEIQLNKYEKSINITIRNFGYDINSPEYLSIFMRLYESSSLFNECLKTDVKLFTSNALKAYRYGVGFEDEARIKELVNKLNVTYLESKLNFEFSDEEFREVMEKMALRKEEILDEYAWIVCHCRTEQAKENLRNTFTGNDNIIERIKSNRSQNPKSYPLEPIPWVESVWVILKKIVPQLSRISVETIVKTLDEYKDVGEKTDELLSLIEKQQKTFTNTYFNLLFESFLSQDILTGSDSPEELDFAEKTKKYRIEFKNSLGKKEYKNVKKAVDRFIYYEHKTISEFIAKHRMPSILCKISDNQKEILRELLKLHGYQHLLEYQESNSVE